MVQFKRLARGVVFPVVIALTASSLIANTANAELVGTSAAVEKYSAKQARDRLESLIERDDVQKEFKAYGVGPAEAKARVAAMSDAQVTQLMNRFDKEPAGQGAVGVIVGAAVLVFFVLLATDLLCLTHVFKFTKCAVN